MKMQVLTHSSTMLIAKNFNMDTLETEIFQIHFAIKALHQRT